MSKVSSAARKSPTDTVADGVMIRLKTSTQSLHDLAEKHAFQRMLMRGELPLSGYAAYLGQMFLVHGDLEALLASRADHAAFRLVLRSHHFRVNHLRDDLRGLSMDADCVEALPATRRLIEEVRSQAAGNPLTLLGHLYVLEGSTNGGKFIAAAVRRAYGFAESGSLSYLDPHGPRQRDRWQAFKDSMEAVHFSASRIEMLVAAASTVFSGIVSIFDDLHDTFHRMPRTADSA